MFTRIRSNHVFINCPFDAGYRPMFNAIVFAVQDLGFIPRCSLEEDDGAEFRLSKIERIIEQCSLGIHDLSAVALDASTGLPRFNMPLELGLFLGCKRYGPENQSKKKSLILDREPYRYRAFISDIAGQDIHSHNAEPERVVGEIRDWLRVASKRTPFPTAAKIIEDYQGFQRELPGVYLAPALDRLTFFDLSKTIIDWQRRSL